MKRVNCITKEQAIDLLAEIFDSIDDESPEYAALMVLRKYCTPLVGESLLARNLCFDSDFRHGVSLSHRLVYAFVDTVAANCQKPARMGDTIHA